MEKDKSILTKDTIGENLKKWRITKKVTIAILLVFLIHLVIDAIICMNMTYPHPMLGIDAYKWTEQFTVDLVFILIIWGIPLIIDVVFLIISCIKTKKN